MPDHSEIKDELDERLRLAGVTVPPGREEIVLALYVELRRALETIRAWAPPVGQTPATIFGVAPRTRRDG